MKQAFIYLQNESTDSLQWLLVDSGSERPENGSGSLEELATAVAGHQVIGVVGAQHVLLTHATLEFTQAAKLRKAVPYALEEQVSEDVEDLHFSLGQIEAGNTQVAVIRDRLLRQWREQLADVGVFPRAIASDLLLLPWSENQWSLLISGDHVIVRTGEFSGFTAEREGLEELIMAILETQTMPESINVWYCGDRVKPMQWAENAPPITTPPCPNGALGVLAGQWDARQSLNLLQGSHSSEPNVAKALKPWRWVAALVVLWVGVQTAGQFIEKQRLSAQLTQINQQLVSIYRRTFPEAKKVVNPRVQMEQRLRELKGSGDSDDSSFVLLLAKSSEVMSKHSNTVLNGVSYRNGTLNLQLSAKNLSDLDNLKNDIAASDGMQAELAAADSSSGKASAQIRIKAQ